MPSDASFLSSTGFLLSQLGVVATRSWTALLAERGITPHHHGILLTLHGGRPLTLTALAAATLVDPRNMGPVLEPLESRGLVVSATDPGDRRRRLLVLTPAGTEVARELTAAATRIVDELLDPLDSAQRETLRGLLATLWRAAR